MYLMELQQISIKNSRKSAESAFYGEFSAEILWNSTKHWFWVEIAQYLKITQNRFLELERS